jgi:hypothetical protein
MYVCTYVCMFHKTCFLLSRYLNESLVLIQKKIDFQNEMFEYN